MSDRVLVALPDGTWLALSAVAFAEAKLAGAEANPAPSSTSVAAEPERLLTAEQLSERTSVPASWWESAARSGDVPCRRIGKYVRFVFREVEEAYRPRPTDLDSAIAFRRRLKTGS